jgi:hypothetical protein
MPQQTADKRSTLEDFRLRHQIPDLQTPKMRATDMG